MHTGLAYGAYHRPGQSPDAGIHPTEAEVREDLAALRDVTSHLFVFSSNRTTNFDDFVRAALEPQYGFTVMATAFLNDLTEPWAPGVNQDEVDGLVSLLNDPQVALRYAMVGSEAVSFQNHSVADVIARINEVRAATAGTTTPIGSSDTWSTWRDNPALAAAVDVIGLTIYPYWEGISIDTAAAYTMARVDEIKALYPGKEVIVTEFGWPSAGSANGAAVPSVANAERYLRETMELFEANDIEAYAFASHDEAWKIGEGSVGPHWGLFQDDGAPKHALVSLITPDATNGEDFIIGTPADDTIAGLDGRDVMQGREGNDQIRGGEGNDVLSGDGTGQTVEIDVFSGRYGGISVDGILIGSGPAARAAAGAASTRWSSTGSPGISWTTTRRAAPSRRAPTAQPPASSTSTPGAATSPTASSRISWPICRTAPSSSSPSPTRRGWPAPRPR